MSTPSVTPQQSAPLNPLVGKIRAMHPGAYDDMDDATLTKAVLAKYPQYEDLARPDTTMPGAPSTQPAMQGSFLGTLEGGPTDTHPMGSKVPRSIEQAPDAVGEVIGGATALGAASPAISAAAPIVSGTIAKQMAQHPVLGPAVASYLISKAREIPGVGKMIPSGSELIPFVMGHGKGEPPEAEPTYSGAPEPTMPTEIQQSQGLRSAYTPAAQPASQTGEALANVPSGNISAAMQKPQPAEVAPNFSRGNLGNLLDKALGAKQLEPNVPLRNQINARPSAPLQTSADLPEGHTAVQSSAAKSYKYDPDANEFHARYASGNTTYVFGDVAPEEVQAFEQADSKGKALQQMKANHPLVAKIVDGKRIAVKGASGSISSGIDAQ